MDVFKERESGIETLREEIRRLYEGWTSNHVSAEDALRADLAGMRIFEEPLIGISGAAAKVKQFFPMTVSRFFQ